MATSIEQRIVQLGLDNVGFQKNAEQSIQTLDRLDNSLDSFGKGGSSLQNIENMLGQITDRFSTMGIVGDQVIRTLTSKAMELVGQLGKVASSMSIEQISNGWGKYADKTQAVQTIMAATAKDWDDRGAQMDYVNSQLERLNWFTDETSYSFLDMVNNIGKFTSNGIKLDDAVTSMEGISVWAAISGANVGEAGRAMYNLSQAMAVGSVKLMDWRSIENANMSTREFKETALETAVALKQLTKEVDKNGKAVYKTAKGHAFTAEQFNTYLSDDWFNKDVLQQTLNKYGEFAGVLGEVSEATGMTASDILGQVKAYKESKNAMEGQKKVSKELLPYIEKLAKDEYDLGYRAFLAAQEAKTLKEAIDSVKDAVSTGWMNIFEMIFGDYENAKVLWTDLAETLYNIFAEPVNQLKEIVKDAFTDNSGWTRFERSLKDAGISITDFEQAYRRWSTKDGSHEWQKMIHQYGSLQEAFEQGAISLGSFHHTLSQINQDARGTTDDIGAMLEQMEKYKTVAKGWSAGLVSDEELEKLGYSADLVHFIANWMRTGTTDAKTLIELTKQYKPEEFERFRTVFKLTEDQAKALNSVLENSSSILEDIANNPKRGVLGRELFTEGFLNLFHALEGVAEIVGNAFEKVFGGTDKLADKLYSAIEKFNAFSKKLLLSEDAAKGLEIIFTDILTVFQKIGQLIGKILGLGGKGVGSVWDGFINFLERVGRGEKITLLSFLLEKLGGVYDWVAGIFSKSESIWSKIGGWIDGAVEKIGQAVAYIKNAFKTAFGGEGMGIDLFKVLGAGIGGIFAFKTGKGLFDTLSGIFKVLKSPADLINSVKESLDGLAEALQGFSQKTENTAADIRSIAISIGIMALALAVLASIDEDQLGHAITALVSIAGVIALLIGTMENVTVLSRKAKDLKGTISNAISQFMEVQKIKAIGTAMIEIAAAILILSFAVRSFSKLSWPDLAKGLAALALTLLMVSISMEYLNDTCKRKNLTQIGLAMIGIAVAMLILSAAVRILGKMDFISLAKGVMALAVMMLFMTVAVESLAQIASGKKLLAAGAALMMVAVAMLVLAAVVAVFSFIPIDNLVQGLGALLVAMYGVVLALALMSKLELNVGTMLAGALAMIMVSAAMLVMAVAVGILAAAMNKNESALLGMVGLIVVMAAAIGILAMINPVALIAAGAAMMLAGIGFALGAVGMIALAKAMEMLQGVKIDITQLLLLAAGLLALGYAGLIFGLGGVGLIIGGTGLLLVAAALRVMTGTNVSADYLLSLGGALMALGLAGLVFGLGGLGLLLGGAGLLALGLALQMFQGLTVKPDDLMGFADAITLLGVGGIMFGIGGVAMLAGALGWLVGIPVLESLAEVLPKLADGFNSFNAVDWEEIGKSATALYVAVSTLFALQFATILDGVPVLKELSEVMPGLAESFKSFEDVNGDLIKSVSDAMSSAIKSLFKLQFSTIIDGTKGLNSLSEALPKLADAFHAFDEFEPQRITDLTTALSDGINKLLGNAFSNLFKGGIDFHSVAVGIAEIANSILLIPPDVEIRLKCFEIINDGLLDLEEAPWKEVTNGFKKLTTVIVALAGESLMAAAYGINMIATGVLTLNGALTSLPENMSINMEATYQAIVEWSPQIVRALQSMVITMVQFLASMQGTWFTMGAYVSIGLASGIQAYAGAALEAAYSLASQVQEVLSSAFEINSPSRVTERMGGFIDAGLAKGIQNGSEEVENSMYTVVDPLLATLAALMSEDFDISPTITPVIDMTDVDAAAGYLNDSLSRSYSSSARIDAAISRRMNDVNRVAASMDREPIVAGGDNVTINVYPSQGMDENALADAVMLRMASRMQRRRAALGT